MEFINPEVAMEIVRILYYGSKRASNLVKSVIEATGVSEPTVYSVLTELAEKGVIQKNKRSKRNVTYNLTDEGRDILKKEHFLAIDSLLTSVKNPARRREILVELLLDDLLEDLPNEWKDPGRKDALRRSMKDEIDDVKRRLVRLTDAMK
jgi:predicted transcriptional regulator